VGKNDCGKSNILRALNLFFNDETNHRVRFNFDEDYNFFAPERQRKAKEIVVRLELDIPDSYRRTNGDLIVWEKRWRKEGLTSGDTKYYGVRLGENRRGRETREEVEIPEKSNVHALLRKIEFEYVPAIKDSRYFDDLRGRIYDLISEVAARTFRTSSTAFEQSIGEHLAALTASIDETLGDTTRLALPRDLSHIFERLDFLSGEQSISLENRGDGIKARHIPLILTFMAQRKAELQGRGGQPTSFIWGYEEPENNLEFASAISLSDELVKHVEENVAQILLTTHSPVFYDLAKKDSSIFLHHVARSSNAEGTKARTETGGLDESLGTLAMVESRVSEIVAEVREQEKAKSEALQLAEQNRPKIFVEGESDAVILRRTLELFFPQHSAAIDFQTKRAGAGHTYVIDMLVGWRSQHKHHPERPKAVGILDGDAENEKKLFNGNGDNIKSAKCFCYPKPPHVLGALQNGFKLPIDLETLYLREVWEWADENNHLEARALKEIYPADLTERILAGEEAPDAGIDAEWGIYVQRKFKSEFKIPCANYIARKNDNDARAELLCFEPLLKEALTYLGLLENGEDNGGG
tara:strand:+ start:818 stop:2563 length:1746 start_codon:yes stop_codon:yes gene_type:complete